MKQRWLIALAVSTVFHGLLVLGVRAAIRVAAGSVSQTPAPVARESVGKPVEFIRIGLREKAPGKAARLTPVAPTPPKPPEGQVAAQAGHDDQTPLTPAEGFGAAEAVPERGAETGVLAASATAETTAAPKRAPSSEMLGLVHARLAQSAARCYPPAAKRFRQSGVVTVSFCTTALGTISQVTVDASSGSALLDHAASDCVVPSANPLPIEAAHACFRLPVRFGYDTP